MTERPMTDEDYEGWRYICRTHEWMSNKVPCPRGDGEDTHRKEPADEHRR